MWYQYAGSQFSLDGTLTGSSTEGVSVEPDTIPEKMYHTIPCQTKVKIEATKEREEGRGTVRVCEIYPIDINMHIVRAVCKYAQHLRTLMRLSGPRGSEYLVAICTTMFRFCLKLRVSMSLSTSSDPSLLSGVWRGKRLV